MKFWFVLLFIGMGHFVNAQEVIPEEVTNEIPILKTNSKKENEKALKKAQKAQKKAEKELKAKQRAQDNFEKATKKLEQNQTKYEKLKNKGKLSPNDEEKWLKSLNKYKKEVESAQKKLFKS